MKKRHVFIAEDLASAERCVTKAQRLGLNSEAISIIAKSNAQLQLVPEDLRDTSPTDFVPAALRGAAGGGGTGLLLGLVATAIPTMGVTLAGAGIFALVGAAVGSWSAALVGASTPNQATRDLETWIDAGRILVVLDVEEEQLAEVDEEMANECVRKAEYETISTVS
jgi:hypothetical protein